MTVSLDITLDDLLAYNRNYVATDRRTRKRLLIYRIVFPLLWFAIAVPTVISSRHIDTFTTVLAVLFLAWLLFLPRWVVWMSIRRAKKLYSDPANSKWLGPRKMTFDEKGVESVNGQDCSFVGWGSVARWEETDGFFSFTYLP